MDTSSQLEREELDFFGFVLYSILVTLATLLLLGFELVGAINIGWFYCFVPIWGPIMLLTAAIGIFILGALIVRTVKGR